MPTQQTAFCAAILNPPTCNHPSLLNLFTGQHIHSHVYTIAKFIPLEWLLSYDYTHRHRKDNVLMYMWLQAEVDQKSRPSLSVKVMVSNLVTPLLLLS